MKRLCSLSFASFLSLVIAGCATEPTEMKMPLLRDEAIQMDQVLSEPLASRIEKTTTLVKDVDSTVFLRDVAEQLILGEPEMRDSPVGVFLIQGQMKPWRTYGIPGVRLYLPRSQLKYFEYEHELASMIAIEIANLFYRLVTQKVTSAIGPKVNYRTETIEDFLDFPGFKSLLYPTAVEFLRSVEKATSILYHGGYDPRGMVAYLEMMLKHQEYSPQDPDTLNEALSKVKAIAYSFPPILSPKLRTDAFVSMKRRIER